MSGYSRKLISLENALKEVIKDLKSAATGLLNIKSTYINDTKFCCDIDTILEYITARLSQFDENNESCEIIIEEDD